MLSRCGSGHRGEEGKKADHVLCAKANQPGLLTGIEQCFALKPAKDSWEDTDADHGRITTRTCAVIDDLELIPVRQEWPGPRTIARGDSEVYHKAAGQKIAMTR